MYLYIHIEHVQTKPKAQTPENPEVKTPEPQTSNLTISLPKAQVWSHLQRIKALVKLPGPVLDARVSGWGFDRHLGGF